MRFCFRMGGLAGLLTLGLCAESLPETPAHHVSSVVRLDRRSGKLVRTLVTQPQPAARTAAPDARHPAAAFTGTVDRIAAETSVPPALLHSVIKVESNFNPFAISPKGARGLMQLIPATARRFGVADPFDPADNIQGGARYLKYLLDLYHGDYPLALAAYNAGEEAVARYAGVPPYRETQNYVVQVQKQLQVTAKSTADATAKPPESTPPPEEPSGPRHLQGIVEPDGSVRYVSR
ncbi:MAG: hypothetical protein C5B51_00230 [Terriglobia bacterium]|nr:MAG: hypothetical protein C5B51_00230 [Terriglobia bacterium]